MKALSIKQPWAWLIANGYKTIENRSWRYPPKYRGPLAIHASKGCTRHEYESAILFAQSIDPSIRIPALGELNRGGIVAHATLVGCTRESDDPWYMGELGLILDNVQPVEFLSCKGQLGFFEVDLIGKAA